LRLTNCKLVVSAIFFFCSIALAENNSGIYIKHAELFKNEQNSLLNARVDYYLNDDIIEALNNGITLTFNATLVITENRSWLWNKRLATYVFPYRIKFHTLSQTYQVIDATNNRKHVFSGLAPAFHALGTVSDITLNGFSIDPTKTLSAKLGVSINIEALPLPMRPLAYVTPSWHIQSNSYQWPLNP